MAHNLQKFQSDSSQVEISSEYFIPRKFFWVLDQLGLYFTAINLTLLQIVGNLFVYNQWIF